MQTSESQPPSTVTPEFQVTDKLDVQEKNNILIVDDSATVRKILKKQFSTLGYTCKTAENGQEALDLLPGNEFDIVVVDLEMPIMDGLTLLSAIRELDVNTVPIVLTGKGEVSKAVQSIKLGAFDYIEKSAQKDALHQICERAIKYRQVLSRSEQMTNIVKQWESIFDAWPEIVIVLDLDQCILQCNQATAKRFNTTKEELIGSKTHEKLFRQQGGDENPFLRIHDDDAPQLVEFPLSYETRDYHVVSVALSDNFGNLWGSMHTISDVTERKKAEEELIRLAAFPNKNPNPVFECESDGFIRYVNPSAESIFRKIQVSTPRAVLPENHVDLIKKCLRTKESILNIEVKSGDYTFSWDYNPLPDANLVHIYGLDITEIKQAEIERSLMQAQLKEAQKLEAIGHLAAGIAHEINTPTQFVTANNRFLQEAFGEMGKLFEIYNPLVQAAKKNKENEEIVKKAEELVENNDFDFLQKRIPTSISQSLEGLDRIAIIVRAMKDFANPGSLEKTANDINQTLENTITVSHHKWGDVADLDTEFEENLPLVPCVPTEINQTVLNMLVNAAQAIEETGTFEKGKITIRTRRRDDWVEIDIEDNGAGIQPQNLHNIYEPFFSTKEVGTGTGHGLAFAHNVIREKHQGTISVDSEPGKGTKFTIALPINTGF